MRRSLFRHTLLGACLSAPFLLAGCGGDEGVTQNYPPLRYTYLAPISLNVSSIQTGVPYTSAQDGTSLDAMSPEPPVQAVQQMLQDRLVAAGSSGTATVTINTASINRVSDTAVGNISVQVAVTSSDGRQAAYTQASVTRTRTLPDDTSDDAQRAFLYAMTSDLVNAENVELEYQIRQHLGRFLVGGASTVGGPAAPTPVEAQPLGGPGAPVLSAPAVGSPMSLGAPAPLGGPAAPLGGPAAPLGGPALAPAVMPTPYAAPPMPAAMPSMPMSSPAVMPPQTDTTPTMPSGDLGLPQGNPVQLTPPAPVTMPGSAPSPAYQLVTPPPPASAAPVAAPAAPAPVPVKPAPAANPGTLPPLPSSITP